MLTQLKCVKWKKIVWLHSIFRVRLIFYTQICLHLVYLFYNNYIFLVWDKSTGAKDVKVSGSLEKSAQLTNTEYYYNCVCVSCTRVCSIARGFLLLIGRRREYTFGTCSRRSSYNIIIINITLTVATSYMNYWNFKSVYSGYVFQRA